ncbi:MAG: flagellar basal body P-ring protein FlgI [Verrucomicrobia bacterium]|nr:MAG: flagellar basal body P-ring protein FlgI [Verrucomicrobiota bacterium]
MQGRIFNALILAGLVLATACDAARIKDLTVVEGGRENQLVGYGIVSGLAGDGDSSTSFYTVQSIANALQRFGVNIPASVVKSKNVAAVMVTADIPPFIKPGQRIDVTVSSIGDAKALQGGVLLQTPLLGADNTVYAVAQGPVAIGGFLGGTSGPGGAVVQKNHPTVGTISGGAIVEREIEMKLVEDGEMRLLLLNPDFTSAARVAEAINNLYPNIALAADSTAVRVRVPEMFLDRQVDFISALGSIDVIPDTPARIVINERTGTIVATANVRISKVAVSHGSLTITVASTLSASQPGAFAEAGQTVVLPSTQTDVVEKQGGFRVIEDLPSIEEVTTALNAMGVSTREMMSIFQAMKRAGALQAELVIN